MVDFPLRRCSKIGRGEEEMGESAKKATMGEVWAAIKATEEARLKGEEALRKSQQRTEEALSKSQQRTEEARLKGEEALRKAQQRTEEARLKGEEALKEAQQKTEAALQKLTENLNKASGDFTNKWGRFLESLVKGDLVKVLKGRNIEVVRVQPRLVYYENGREAGDFDLVAVNGKEVVAVEVKTTLTVRKVQKFMDSLKRFKEYFPEYGDRVVYGGVAYLCEPEDGEAKGAAEFSQENGLFVIVSPGGESSVTTISNPRGFEPRAF